MDWHPMLSGKMLAEGVDVLLRSKKEQYYIGTYYSNAAIFRVISQYKLQEDGSILGLTTGFHYSYFTHWTEITLPDAVTAVTPEERLCAACGHSESRHHTAGGFCKHCACPQFVEGSIKPILLRW